MTNDTPIPDDIMQAKTEVQLRDAISVAIDDFVGKLHSEKITSITEIIAAERAKCEAELAALRAENAKLRRAVVGSLRLTRAALKGGE